MSESEEPKDDGLMGEENVSSTYCDDDSVRLTDFMPLQNSTTVFSAQSKDSQMFIKRGERGDSGNDELNSIPVLHGPKDDFGEDQDEQYPAKFDSNVFTEWDRTLTNDSVLNETHLRIGETNSRYLGAKSSEIDLKRIGEKTRKLLDEERKKRKEIIRLDDNELLPKDTKTGIKAKKARPEEKIKPNAEIEAGKISLQKGRNKVTQVKKRNVAVKGKHRDSDKTVDGWMPNTEDLISKSTRKDDRSNIVRLHGLPIGVKPDQIRKFFHGLNPSQIFVLPTFNYCIKDWDAQYHSYPGGGSSVRRHSAYLRVFVKFQSVLVADAGIDRNGESIGFDQSSNICDLKEVVRAAISLSPVPKYIASYLQKHMAVLAIKGESIIQTLTNVEKQVGDVVNYVWSIAKKKLRLELFPSHYSFTSEFDRLVNENENYSIPRVTLEYNRLVKIYNQLIEEHEKLEMNKSLLLTHCFDPSNLEDSANRLIHSVSNWLLDEVALIGNHLREYRALSKLLKH